MGLKEYRAVKTVKMGGVKQEMLEIKTLKMCSIW